jgi:hypothetical protein
VNREHLTRLLLGVGAIAVGALLPATAPYLLPVGASLLLFTNPHKLRRQGAKSPTSEVPTKVEKLP